MNRTARRRGCAAGVPHAGGGSAQRAGLLAMEDRHAIWQAILVLTDLPADARAASPRVAALAAHFAKHPIPATILTDPVGDDEVALAQAFESALSERGAVGGAYIRGAVFLEAKKRFAPDPLALAEDAHQEAVVEMFAETITTDTYQELRQEIARRAINAVRRELKRETRFAPLPPAPPAAPDPSDPRLLAVQAFDSYLAARGSGTDPAAAAHDAGSELTPDAAELFAPLCCAFEASSDEDRRRFLLSRSSGRSHLQIARDECPHLTDAELGARRERVRAAVKRVEQRLAGALQRLHLGDQ